MSSQKTNIVANFIGQAWIALMGFAFIPLYVSYLGIEAYGFIGFYAILQAWLSFPGNAIGLLVNREVAIHSATTQYGSILPYQLRWLEIIAAIAASIIGFLIFFLSPVIGKYWIKPTTIPLESISHCISLMGIVVALRVFETLYQGIIAGTQKQLRLNCILAFIATLRWGGVIGAFEYYSPTVESFFLWQVITSLLSVVALMTTAYVSLPCKPQNRFPKLQDIMTLRMLGEGILVGQLSALLITSTDKLILSKILSLEDLGLYTLASTIASGLLLITTPISQAYYPKFSQMVASNNPRHLIQSYHAASKLVTLSVGPACFLMAFFGVETLTIWTGNREISKQAASILVLLAIGNGLHALMHIPYVMQIANGWPQLSSRINLFACILSTPALIYFVPLLGPLAAATVWAALNIAYVLIGIYLMHQNLLINERMRWYVDDIAKPLFPIIIAAITAASVTDGESSRAELAFQLAIFALIFYAVSAFQLTRFKNTEIH